MNKLWTKYGFQAQILLGFYCQILWFIARNSALSEGFNCKFSWLESGQGVRINSPSSHSAPSSLLPQLCTVFLCLSSSGLTVLESARKHFLSGLVAKNFVDYIWTNYVGWYENVYSIFSSVGSFSHLFLNVTMYLCFNLYGILSFLE